MGWGTESRPPKVGCEKRRYSGSESAELRGTCFPSASGDWPLGESVLAPHRLSSTPLRRGGRGSRCREKRSSQPSLRCGSRSQTAPVVQPPEPRSQALTDRRILCLPLEGQAEPTCPRPPFTPSTTARCARFVGDAWAAKCHHHLPPTEPFCVCVPLESSAQRLRGESRGLTLSPPFFLFLWVQAFFALNE